MTPYAVGFLVQGCIGVVAALVAGFAAMAYVDSGEEIPPWVKWTATIGGLFAALSFIGMGWCLALRV